MSDSRIGSFVGSYRLEEHLGGGRNGDVFRAWDEEIGRQVAVKLLVEASPRAQPDVLCRVRRQGRIVGRLGHPNLAVQYDVGCSSLGVYIATTLVRGPTLEEWLGSKARSWEEIVDAVIGAGKGLAAIHEVGVTHRDFKPSNILQHDDGRFVVVDTGLASGVDVSDLGTPANERDEFDEVGLYGASIRYAARERIEGSEAIPASDQWSFCASLWEALAGSPVRGASPLEDPRRARRTPPPTAPTNAEVPDRLWRALRRGLDPNPDRRWPTVAELLAELHRARRPRFPP